MRNAHFTSSRGSVQHLRIWAPGDRPPWIQNPHLDTDPPGCNPPSFEADPLDVGHVTFDAC